jgi:hypothetical protein
MNLVWHLVFWVFFATVACTRYWFSCQYRLLAPHFHVGPKISPDTWFTLFVTFNLFWDGQHLRGGRTWGNLWRTMNSTMRMVFALEWFYYLVTLRHGQFSRDEQVLFDDLLVLVVWVKVSWFLASFTNNFDVKCVFLIFFAAVFYYASELFRSRVAACCVVSKLWWYLMGQRKRYCIEYLWYFSFVYACLVIIIWTK